MHPYQKIFSARKFLVSILFGALFNTAIAGLITMLGAMGYLWQNFVYSQCIGFSIFIFNILILPSMKPGVRRLAVMSLTLPGSVAVGLTLAFYITGVGSWRAPVI